jgi:hypothetical protein
LKRSDYPRKSSRKIIFSLSLPNEARAGVRSKGGFISKIQEVRKSHLALNLGAWQMPDAGIIPHATANREGAVRCAPGGRAPHFPLRNLGSYGIRILSAAIEFNPSLAK